MTLLIPILASFLGGIFALAGVLLTQRRQNELEQQRYTHALHDAKGQRIRAACAVLVAVADIRADAVRVLQLPERSALPEVPSEITAIFEASRVKSFIARGELALETEAREVADLDTQLFQRYVDFVDARRANFARPRFEAEGGNGCC